MLKVGILGAAGIAPRSIIAPARRRHDVAVAAVASARPGAAEAYAAIHGIPRVFSSYAALIADQAIDIVYNALPPVAHAAWSIAALEAGKHVLCEKPVAMTAAEARRMIDVARRHDRILMEGFHDRYHPLTLRLLNLRDSGRLGTLRFVRAEFQVDLPFDPRSIRHDPAQGGGAMMDLGCYPLHWLRTLFASEPRIVSAEGAAGPLGVDERMAATLAFGAASAELAADMTQGPMRAHLHVECEQGTLDILNPVLPHLGHSVTENLGGVQRQYTVAGQTSFDHQLQALVDAVTLGTPPLTGGTDAVANMVAIEAICRAAGFDRHVA
jgi:predicted dehydrogenase